MGQRSRYLGICKCRRLTSPLPCFVAPSAFIGEDEMERHGTVSRAAETGPERVKSRADDLSMVIAVYTSNCAVEGREEKDRRKKWGKQAMKSRLSESNRREEKLTSASSRDWELGETIRVDLTCGLRAPLRISPSRSFVQSRSANRIQKVSTRVLIAE